MDRLINYAGAIPLDTDLLSTNKNAMIAIGYLIRATLGASTLVDGLTCSPTTPTANMQVQVGAGAIYSLANMDGTAYGSLAADTTNVIMKQGLSLPTTALSCPAPGTAGMSQVYLVEVAYQDVDSSPIILPYYNASNPTQAFSGPGNTGVAQNTVRQGACVIQVKAGIAATTGTQVAPAADSGFTALYTVTVANGQTSITSSSIAAVVGAPFIANKINQLGVYAIDTGTANTYAATFTPRVAALVDGMVLRVRAAHANTGASTFLADSSLSALSIVGQDHGALQGGEIVVNGEMELQYNSALSAWILLASSGGYQRSVTPPFNDVTNKVATMAAVKAAGLVYPGGGTGITTATTLTASILNSWCQITAGVVVTLPPIANATFGNTITLINAAAGITIKGNGSEQIYFQGGGNGNTYSPVYGETLVLVSNGAGTGWFVVASGIGGSLFGNSLVANGYQRLPGGLIMQWGVGTIAPGGSTITYPIAFPTASRGPVLTASTTGTTDYFKVTATSTTAFTAASTTVTLATNFIVFGN